MKEKDQYDGYHPQKDGPGDHVLPRGGVKIELEPPITEPATDLKKPIREPERDPKQDH